MDACVDARADSRMVEGSSMDHSDKQHAARRANPMTDLVRQGVCPWCHRLLNGVKWSRHIYKCQYFPYALQGARTGD